MAIAPAFSSGKDTGERTLQRRAADRAGSSRLPVCQTMVAGVPTVRAPHHSAAPLTTLAASSYTQAMTIAPDSKPAASPALRAAIALAVTVALTVAAITIMGDAAYLWVKSVHVMAIIAWMAAMLYLPRLFIYHAEVDPKSDTSQTFKVMEKRLLRIIMNPAMVIAWVLGLWLGWKAGYFHSGWFHAKLALAIALSAMHGYLSAAVRHFAEDRNTVPARTWRILNEVPALLMVGIVILVIVKPF